MRLFALLVQNAKGNDRSMRQYAKDSGVDVAIISKMISGNYMPKTKQILEALVSEKAQPRNGVTYEMLANEVILEAMLELKEKLKEKLEVWG